MGLNRNAYGADINAADAVDIRRALGYAQWDIYGVSYGGQVAQELLRIDSPATHAAALISTVSPGPHYAAEWSLSYQRNLENVFTSCAAQSQCQRAFPNLRQDFDSLYQEFSARPLKLPPLAYYRRGTSC
jgi:pimeloyl-ACP methyl ester carboxylesterase